jgi:hypothetical protein
MRSLAGACLMLACLGAAAAPTRAEIGWEISRNGTVIAEAVDSLEQDGKTYSITSNWKGRGLLSLIGEARRSSRGVIVAGGLRPQEFEDVRTGRNTARASFDWALNTLTLQYKGPARSAPIPANAYDRLTQLYGFAFRAPGAGEPVQMNVADGRGVSDYAFEVAGREALKTPAGEFETLKLVKRKSNPEDRSTEVWLALRQHHLPVRVLVVEKDGTRIDQIANRVSAQ